MPIIKDQDGKELLPIDPNVQPTVERLDKKHSRLLWESRVSHSRKTLWMKGSNLSANHQIPFTE